MSDWDFLHDMNNEGYSADQIADAAACGYNPYDTFDISEYGLDPHEWEAIDCAPDQESLDVNPELTSVFKNLVNEANRFHSITNRYLQIWGELGELGELFAEVKYGAKRHRPNTSGSDGKLDDDFIEIKTISPEKSREEVRVKRAGNFNYLLIVKISEDFSFEGRLIARKKLKKGEGKYMRASWQGDYDSNMPNKQQ